MINCRTSGLTWSNDSISRRIRERERGRRGAIEKPLMERLIRSSSLLLRVLFICLSVSLFLSFFSVFSFSCFRFYRLFQSTLVGKGLKISPRSAQRSRSYVSCRFGVVRFLLHFRCSLAEHLRESERIEFVRNFTIHDDRAIAILRKRFPCEI